MTSIVKSGIDTTTFRNDEGDLALRIVSTQVADKKVTRFSYTHATDALVVFFVDATPLEYAAVPQANINAWKAAGTPDLYYKEVIQGNFTEGAHTQDVAPLTISTATVENAAATNWVITFSGNAFARNLAGVTVKVGGTAIAIASYTIAGAVLTIVTRAIVNGEVLTLDVNGTTNVINDGALMPNYVANVAAQAVTNNVV